MIIFGTITIRPTKSYKSQSIGTQFFMLGIPLIPLNSYFFKEGNIILEIGVYWKHVCKVYAFNVALLSLIYIIFVTKSLTQAILVILTFLVFIFLFDFTSQDEKKKRDLVQQIIGINAIPEYMNYDTSVDTYNKLQRLFNEKYNQNWKNLLESREYNDNQIPHLLTLIMFERSFMKTKKNEENYEYLWGKFNELK